MRDSLEIAGIVIGVTVGALGLMFGVGVAVMFGVAQPECYARAKAQSLEADWGFFQGCVVKTEQGWLPYETYQARVVEQNIAVRVK